jgi:hypothetical protein
LANLVSGIKTGFTCGLLNNKPTRRDQLCEA